MRTETQVLSACEWDAGSRRSAHAPSLRAGACRCASPHPPVHPPLISAVLTDIVKHLPKAEVASAGGRVSLTKRQELLFPSNTFGPLPGPLRSGSLKLALISRHFLLLGRSCPDHMTTCPHTSSQALVFRLESLAMGVLMASGPQFPIECLRGEDLRALPQGQALMIQGKESLRRMRPWNSGPNSAADSLEIVTRPSLSLNLFLLLREGLRLAKRSKD